MRRGGGVLWMLLPRPPGIPTTTNTALPTKALPCSHTQTYLCLSAAALRGRGEKRSRARTRRLQAATGRKPGKLESGERQQKRGKEWGQ